MLFDIVLGGFNTVVLLLSSVTMASSVWCVQKGKNKQLIIGLCATLFLGCVFLFVKYFEYKAKWEHNLVPGTHFNFHGTGVVGAPAQGQIELFFLLYFIMTGMHALHMVVGACLLVWLIVLAARGHFSPQKYMKVELFGFYWHFVDIVWVFLFPLLYLLHRHT